MSGTKIQQLTRCPLCGFSGLVAIRPDGIPALLAHDCKQVQIELLKMQVSGLQADVQFLAEILRVQLPRA